MADNLEALLTGRRRHERKRRAMASATTHYIDLATQTVEVAGNEARIVVNGQLTRCTVEDEERAAAGGHSRRVSNLYLRRKG
jgi:hypothetical protein